jgi:hypothetical protein
MTNSLHGWGLRRAGSLLGAAPKNFGVRLTIQKFRCIFGRATPGYPRKPRTPRTAQADPGPRPDFSFTAGAPPAQSSRIFAIPAIQLCAGLPFLGRGAGRFTQSFL